jgi:glycosyltransferase involved in cell wall biosynthesis
VFGTLASQLMFPKGDAEAIALKVQQFTNQSVREDVGRQLRAVVVEAHGLERLIKVITKTLAEKQI